VVGTVPAIKPAAALSKSRVIAVLGTEATVRQPYVDDLSRIFAADCVVIRNGSSRLVELAEEKMAGRAVSQQEVRAAVQPGFDREPFGDAVDVTVLACTHFPLLLDELVAAFPDMDFVDGSHGIARRIAYLTRGQPWPVTAPPGKAIFTGGAPSESLIASLRQFGIEEVGTL
jgi:glutamate racemase